MKVRIEIDEGTMKQLIKDHLNSQLGDLPVLNENIDIQVKSKQNYKSEWEEAAFRAVYYTSY